MFEAALSGVVVLLVAFQSAEQPKKSLPVSGEVFSVEGHVATPIHLTFILPKKPAMT